MLDVAVGKVDMEMSALSDVSMLLTENALQFITLQKRDAALAGKPFMFKSGDWLATLTDSDLDRLYGLTLDFGGADKEEFYDDVLAVTIQLTAAEYATLNLNLDFLAQSVGVLQVITSIERSRRKGLLKITLPLSIRSDAESKVSVTDAGKDEVHNLYGQALSN